MLRNQSRSKEPDPLYVLRSGRSSITSLKFVTSLPDNEEYLISGTQDGVILFWDLKTRRVKKEFKVSETHSILFIDLIYIDDKQYLISHDRDGIVKLFEVSSTSEVILKRSWKIYEFGFCPIQLCVYDGSYHIGYPANSDSQMSVTKLTFQENIDTYDLKPKDKLGMVMDFRMFQKEYQEKSIFLVICGYENGNILLWNIITTCILDTKNVYQNPIMSMDFHLMSSKVLVTSSDNMIQMIELNENLKFTDPLKHTSKSTGFSASRIRHDGKISCVGGWDGKLRVLASKSLKSLAVLNYHCETINAIDFSLSKWIACGGKDGKISLWNVYQNT